MFLDSHRKPLCLSSENKDPCSPQFSCSLNLKVFPFPVIPSKVKTSVSLFSVKVSPPFFLQFSENKFPCYPTKKSFLFVPRKYISLSTCSLKRITNLFQALSRLFWQPRQLQSYTKERAARESNFEI